MPPEKKLTVAELAEIVTSLREAISTLQSKVEALKPASPVPPLSREEAPQAERPNLASTPVPLEYREIADTILNRSFGLEIVPRQDLPAFELTVLVPQTYSNASSAHWDMYHADRRTKVISYADGLHGVRAYIEQIFNNLDQDTRTRVVTDRINNP